MALNAQFGGLTDFDTERPAKLRQDLQREHRDVGAAFARIEKGAEALLTERVAIGTVEAAFGEALLCDSTNADIVINAPEIRAGDASKPIDVVHVRPGNSVIFRARPPQLVQGTVSVTFTTIGYWRIRAYGGNWLVQQ